MATSADSTQDLTPSPASSPAAAPSAAALRCPVDVIDDAQIARKMDDLIVPTLRPLHRDLWTDVGEIGRASCRERV